MSDTLTQHVVTVAQANISGGEADMLPLREFEFEVGNCLDPFVPTSGKYSRKTNRSYPKRLIEIGFETDAEIPPVFLRYGFSG